MLTVCPFVIWKRMFYTFQNSFLLKFHRFLNSDSLIFTLMKRNTFQTAAQRRNFLKKSLYKTWNRLEKIKMSAQKLNFTKKYNHILYLLF